MGGFLFRNGIMVGINKYYNIMPRKIANKKTESYAVQFENITNDDLIFDDIDFGIDECALGFRHVPKSEYVKMLEMGFILDDEFWNLGSPSEAFLESPSDSNEFESADDGDLRGFISPEFGAAKCERPDTEAVCTKVKIIKDALIEILNGIQARQEFCVGQPINCQDGKEGRNRFTNSCKFYLPDFVMQLLQEYGFTKEIKKLKLGGPRHRIDGLNHVFEKDIHAMYNICSIDYSCTLKQSLRNFFVMVDHDNPLHWAGLHYVQYLYNTCQGKGNWTEFTNNDAVRSLGHSYIPSKHYTNANKAIFSLYSIWSFRKDEKKGGRKRDFLL